jgi:Mn-dependent DtxR family transcriptional regulator
MMPDRLDEKLKSILTHFKRQGGQGNISDVRRAAQVSSGDGYVKKLIERGLMRRVTNDFYVLTSDGYAEANKMIDAQHK